MNHRPRRNPRLSDGSSFDHGATLFEPVTASFRQRLATWEADGLVERVGVVPAGGREDGTYAFRVRGPATSLAKHLARGLDVRLGVKAESLSRDGAGFVLTLEDGATLRGAAAILTPPVPQALDLLSRGGLAGQLPEDLRAALAAVFYHPGLVLLLRLDRRTTAIPPAGLLALRDGGPVARIVENARDGGPSRLSVYARESVATERFDAPAEETTATLEAAALDALGLGAAAVVERDLKRWRYARPKVTFPGEVPLADLDGAPLVFAGDAFGRVEAVPPTGNTGLERAALAGLAAAGRLLGLPARGAPRARG
ncbi:MAG: FAD-dependent oxidoreductase [Acidobacteria bacterium]|nr:FAD-dependent oxidoreductase [Acidobacteriota bacterium]